MPKPMPTKREIARKICCPDGCHQEGEKSLGIERCSAEFTYQDEAAAVLKLFAANEK